MVQRAHRAIPVGAVAAGHQAVARVGAEVLEAGGNAVDAAAAMVAAGCVCEGTLTSFGGGGFMIIGGGPLPDPVMLDFFVRQPGFEPRPRLSPWEVHALELDGVVLRYGTGPASVAVPGTPRGLAHAVRRYGRLPLRDVLGPAARLAQEGVLLTRTQAGEQMANAALLGRDADGAATYFVDGAVRREGELFRQPLLAAAIEELAETDGESPYVGDLARRLVEWSDRRGGRISRTDLERFEVYERVPLSLRVDDVTMFVNPEPSMGGALAVGLLEAMLLSRRDSPGGPDAGSRRAHRDIAVGRALVDVLQRLDPPRTTPPMPGETVAAWREEGQPSPELHDSMAEALHDRGASSVTHEAAPGVSRSPNTTHVSAIDGDGLLAGATTTVGYGAGEFIPGSGIQLNNMLAEYDHTARRAPGSTVPSMMTPAILASPRTMVQIGSAGSDRIPHAISQILERMWDGATLEDAIDAPRFSFDGLAIHAEPGIDEVALERLERDHEVVRWPVRDAYFGTTNGTAVRSERRHAAGDIRREATGIVLG